MQLIDVDLLEIDPPINILLAMAEQLTSERIRRKVLVEADGNRQCRKIEAEGKSQISQINAAGRNISRQKICEAQAIVRKELAAAQADSIKMIAEAIKDTGVDVGEFNIYTQYLKSVQQIVGKA